MQERFRFRVWHKPLKMMHYNDFVITSTGYVAPIQEEVKGIDYMMRFNQQDLEFDKQCVVMQCTGLKDKNGKLIYEGDICRSEDYPFKSDGNYNYYAEILFDDESASFYYYVYRVSNRVAGRSTGNTGNLSEYEWEVIGNKYEHPELLKGDIKC